MAENLPKCLFVTAVALSLRGLDFGDENREWILLQCDAHQRACVNVSNTTGGGEVQNLTCSFLLVRTNKPYQYSKRCKHFIDKILYSCL